MALDEIKKAYLNDIPKTDKSLPTDEVLITQEGEARLIPSGLISQIGKDGDSAYKVAIDNGFKGSQSEWLESLKGPKGDKGNIGPKGEKGDTGNRGEQGLKGDKGDSFKVDGIVNNIADLPDATTVKDQIWLTNEFGHLHYAKGSNANDWIDWGQFTGVKGDKGDRGPQGIEGPAGKDGKDSDHHLPIGGHPGDVLSKAPNGDLEWSPRRRGYFIQDFEIPNVGNSHKVLNAFDGLCDILFERTTSIMARITVIFKRAELVNMFYSSARLAGMEQRNLDLFTKVGDNWIADPDLIVDNLREVSSIIYYVGGEVIEMQIRAGNKGKVKVWFDKIE